MIKTTDLIAALRRLANDRNSCHKCEFFNNCGVMHCEIAKLAADELERMSAREVDE